VIPPPLASRPVHPGAFEPLERPTKHLVDARAVAGLMYKARTDGIPCCRFGAGYVASIAACWYLWLGETTRWIVPRLAWSQPYYSECPNRPPAGAANPPVNTHIGWSLIQNWRSHRDYSLQALCRERADGVI